MATKELFEFETETLDDGEQNLEEEADELLKTWDRDTLLQEVREERQKLDRERDCSNFTFYDGMQDFDEIAKEMKPISGDQVMIKILESNPEGKAIDSLTTILFDRVGYLEYEVAPFESSVYDGQPSKMNLAEGPAVCGLLLALTHMREGERADVLIRPAMAYGPLGCPPLIPRNATLLYHVKVFKVWDTSKLDQILQYEIDHQIVVPLEEKLAHVEDHKQLANKYMKDNLVKDALVMYKAAVKCLEEVSPGHQPIGTMVSLLQNTSIAMNKLGMHKSASKVAKRALFLEPTSAKAYYQLIKARISLQDYSGATDYLQLADRNIPKSRCFDEFRLQLDNYKRQEKLVSDALLKRMSRAI